MVTHVEMNVHLLGLLGLIVLKVKLLEVLKRLCEHQSPIPVEGGHFPFAA
jgi:separase